VVGRGDRHPSLPTSTGESSDVPRSWLGSESGAVSRASAAFGVSRLASLLLEVLDQSEAPTSKPRISQANPLCFDFPA
jgi:hypothetical protein